jgi:hypothetical protein
MWRLSWLWGTVTQGHPAFWGFAWRTHHWHLARTIRLCYWMHKWSYEVSAARYKEHP